MMDDRTMLAAMAMQGLTAKYGLDPFFYLHAVECADALPRFEGGLTDD